MRSVPGFRSAPENPKTYALKGFFDEINPTLPGTRFRSARF